MLSNAFIVSVSVVIGTILYWILKFVDVRSETKLEKKQEKYLKQVQKLEGDKELPDRDALELIKVNLANINE